MTEIERYQGKDVESARPPVDSWAQVFTPLVQLAEHVAPTEFVPGALRGNAPATAAAMLYGRELGMGPMMSLQNIHVIDGTPTLKPQQMRAMVLAAGHEFQFREHTRARCVIAGRRRGQTSYTIVEWSLQDARDLNLLNKKNWQRIPRQMLVARATGELCRMIFADVIGGAYTPEEIDDGAAPVEPGTVEPEAPPARRSVRRSTPVTRTTKDAAPDKPAAGKPGREPAQAEDDADDGPPLPDEIDNDDSDDDSDASETAPPADKPQPVTAAQLRQLHTVLSNHGVNDRADRLRIARAVVGRELKSSRELTHLEAAALIDLLHTVEKQAGDDGHFLDALDALLFGAGDDSEDGGEVVDAEPVDAEVVDTTDRTEEPA